MTTKEKIKAIWDIISKLVKRPTSIFLVLDDQTESKDYLLKKYGKTEFPTIEISAFLRNGKAEINSYAFLDGGSLITDLALLKGVASNYEECNYLEIGTWRGESIVNVADVKGSKCTSINLSPEDIIKLGLPEKYANEHGCLIKDQKNIKTIYTNSLTFDFSSLSQKFDLIFVDGDHHYEAVKSDTQNIYKLLKDDNSVIVWHDYGYDPVKPRYSVISAILDGMPEDAHKHLYHVSNTMCAIYSKQDLAPFLQKKLEKPDRVFTIEIKEEKIN